MKKHLHKGRCEVLKRLNGNSKDEKKYKKAKLKKSEKEEKSKKFETEVQMKTSELESKATKQKNPLMYQQFTTINLKEISL